MSNLGPKEKLILVRELAEKHSITAYEIGEHTELNTSGIHRILSGEVQNPRDKTLGIILDYIENKIMGARIGKDFPAADPVENNDTIERRVAQEVLKMLQPELEQFKGYHHSIMRALAGIGLDIDELKDLKKDIENNKNKKP